MERRYILEAGKSEFKFCVTHIRFMVTGKGSIFLSLKKMRSWSCKDGDNVLEVRSSVPSAMQKLHNCWMLYISIADSDRGVSVCMETIQ